MPSGDPMLQSINYFSIFLLAILSFSRVSEARTPEEAEFTAAGYLAKEIGSWIQAMPEKPKSMGVFLVHANAPLEQDYATVFETEVLKSLAATDLQNVITCGECKTAQVTVEQDKLIVSRAVPDLETLKRIGKKYAVESFLAVEIYRTKISVIAQAVLYKNPEGNVINAERFSTHALNLTDAGAQVLLTVGGVKTLQGSSSTSFATSGNISILEELGFAKGGMNLGAILDTSEGTLIYLNPTLGLRGHFGNSLMGWSLHLGAGYAISSAVRGFTGRGAFDLYFGTIATLGVEAVYFSPNSGSGTARAYTGLHIGLNFGR